MNRRSATDRGRLARLGATAAVIGGAAWIVKGGAILVTGDQPPLVFALGPPSFALGLLGLHAALGRVDRRARAGAAAAAAAIGLMVAGAVAWAIDPELAPDGEEFAPLSVVQVASAVCLLAALVLLGAAARRPPRAGWATLAVWMGVLSVPGLLVGGALAAVHERLLEIPLVLFALAWVWLGARIWRAAPSTAVRRRVP